MFRKSFGWTRKARRPQGQDGHVYHAARLNRWRPLLEPLETRDAPACFPGISGGVLRANCDNNPNTIALDFSGGNTILYGVSFPTASFNSILINMGSAADTVLIRGVPAGKMTTVNGGGGLDNVFVGDA